MERLKTINEVFELRKKMLQEFELKNNLKYLHILGNEFYDDCVYVSSIEDDHDIKGASNLDWVYCKELNNKFIDFLLTEKDFSKTSLIFQIIGLFLHKNNLKEKVFLIEYSDDEVNFKYYFFPTNNKIIDDFITIMIDTIIVTKESKTGFFYIDRYLNFIYK